MIYKETAEHYSYANGCDGWCLVKRTDVSVIHETMPPGSSEIRHLHRQAWQFFFVLRGKATLELNQKVSEDLPTGWRFYPEFPTRYSTSPSEI